MAARSDGYWPNSPWPGEDGGPLRQQAPAEGGASLALTGRSDEHLQTVSRPAFAATMCVTRQVGEVFLLSHTMGGDTVSWVERLHPESLETIRRSPDLEAGPFWPGGLAAHANGSLYVTYGRWCHRLDPYSLKVMSSRQLPRERPYNSLLITPSGHLVMKDIAGGTGPNRLPEGVTGSELVVLEPEQLEIVARHELPEGSVARLSADGSDIIVVGETRVHRIGWHPELTTLTADPAWSPLYRRFEGQTFGWDIVLAGGSGWFLDNGDGSEEFAGSFRGKGRSTAPLHLVRVRLSDAARSHGGVDLAGDDDDDGDGDGSDEATFTEVCGEPGGVIANPPCIDTDRQIAIGYDSGHGVITAWRFGEPADALQPLWQRRQHHAGHMLRYPETGEVVTYDYDHDRALDEVVVLDIETGDEKARVETPSPIQSVVFPCAGWGRDFYTLTFTTLTRVSAD